MVTDAKSWKKTAGKTHELELPSGNTCLARRPGVQAFISKGLIPNSLLSLLMPLLDDARQPTEVGEKQMEELDAKLEALQQTIFDDAEKFEDLIATTDRVLLYCVVQPKVLPTPVDDDGNERPDFKQDDQLYVDEVDLEDKMYIFQWAVGGVKDLEPFREATGGNVATGYDQPSLPMSSE